MAKLDKQVYDIVVATVADYRRMQEIIEKGKAPREQLALFVKRVNAIDNALIAICKGERHELRESLMVDIAERRGYERSMSRSYFASRKSFDKRKTEAVELIAKFLWLI